VRHAFLDCTLDRERYELRRAGRIVKIEKKVFDVLAYLLDRCERVVTKQELLDALWPGEAVSESVLPRCIAAARRALGDDRAAPRAIQTVHGRGYRFIAAVREGHPAGRAAEPIAPPAAERPTAWPFVGRDAAMQRGIAALDDAAASRGRVVLLVGEPGIGKTRALDELASAARARGFRVLAARCYEGDGAPAFWPWIQVLRAALAEVDDASLDELLGASAADVAELVPELRERRPTLPAPAGSADEQARFRLFDGVAAFLGRLARRRPLWIALDDLHWADAATLRLFEFAASEWRDAPIGLAGSYRDVEVRRDHPLAALLGALARLPHAERISLRGLSHDDVARFLRAALPGNADARLFDAVHEMTEGNPFFLHEMARWLAESDASALRGAAGGWSLALPQSVRDAVGRRLDRLSPACNAVLRAAAVLGRECSGAILAKIVSLDADELLESLGEALAAHVLVELRDAPGRYAFSHALVRQTLYEELPIPGRVRLHRRAAETLGASDRDAHAAEVAHHWLQATPTGDVANAVEWSIRAARRATELAGYEESARLYERALGALDLGGSADDAKRYELHVAAGEAHYAAGARDAARGHGRSAAAIARRLGRADWLAVAAVEFRGGYENGVPAEPETLAVLREALDAIGGGATPQRARLLARLAGCEFDMERRERLSSEALDLARETADPDALREALAARWWATLGPDRVGERDGVAAEMLANADKLRDARLTLIGYECRLGANLIRGESQAAAATVNAYWEQAEELRQPAFRFLARVLRGGCALSAGRFDEAETLFREALSLGRGTIPFADVMFGGQIYWLGLQRGDAYEPAALREFSEGLESRYPSASALARSSMATVLVDADDAAARAAFEALAAHDFRDLPRDEHWLLTTTLLGNLAFALDDRARAAALGALLAPYRQLFVVHDLVRATAGSVEAVLGDVALTCRDAASAIACFERAIAHETRAELEPSRLSSVAGLAAAYALRAGRGDAPRADALLREAEAGCVAIGSRAFARYHDRFERVAARR
jgi:DNA-binding winged helix-turn-helix (wHTH) protein/tetratricopeptide (TPR) repeat protein